MESMADVGRRRKKFSGIFIARWFIFHRRQNFGFFREV
jgi:hypothetical protein